MDYEFMGLQILIIQGYLSYMCEFSSVMMPMVKSENYGQISFNLDTFDLSWEEAYILVWKKGQLYPCLKELAEVYIVHDFTGTNKGFDLSFLLLRLFEMWSLNTNMLSLWCPAFCVTFVIFSGSVCILCRIV